MTEFKHEPCGCPRHVYRCVECGLEVSGREKITGEIVAYDRSADCDKCPPRPSRCMEHA